MLPISTNYFLVKITKILSEHKKILLWLALLWTAIVAYFCLVSFNDIPSLGVKDFDKIGHFVFHFGITSVWFLYYKFRKANSNKKAIAKAFLFSLIYGTAIEFFQAFFTDTRKGDINDVFANMTGSIFAIAVVYTIAILIRAKRTT